jgi:hypothetical protein
MNAVFFVMGAMAMIWSAIRYHFVYRSIVDSFAPQFQDELSSRYAFPVFALSAPTPLTLQAEYVKSLWGSCAAFLCVSLGFFASRNVVVGCFLLAGFFLAVFHTLKSWKIYRENCSRVESGSVEDET